MKRLAVFDFDGTLFDSPEQEDGMRIWSQKTGQQYPHKGWWGRRESLDSDIFDIHILSPDDQYIDDSIVSANIFLQN